ncbi:MAG TPA: VOC family protein [Novosphingobium sp.]|nr:VOC family protein [Novosphingobium sp.]
MFSHLTLGTNDLDKSHKFYDSLFAAIGGAPGTRGDTNIMYARNGAMLMITTPINGQPATFANGGTVGFAMSTPEEVEAWHAAGVSNGGTSCEDPPGKRDLPGISLHLAYLRDPDGNKLCAMYRYP